jgi:hypothetical protein
MIVQKLSPSALAISRLFEQHCRVCELCSEHDTACCPLGVKIIRAFLIEVARDVDEIG